jgi:hypothetical protein
MIHTPAASVETGTARLELSARGDETCLRVEEGEARFFNVQGTRFVSRHKECRAQKGQAPGLPISWTVSAIWRGRSWDQGDGRRLNEQSVWRAYGDLRIQAEAARFAFSLSPSQTQTQPKKVSGGCFIHHQRWDLRQVRAGLGFRFRTPQVAMPFVFQFGVFKNDPHASPPPTHNQNLCLTYDGETGKLITMEETAQRVGMVWTWGNTGQQTLAKIPLGQDCRLLLLCEAHRYTLILNEKPLFQAPLQTPLEQGQFFFQVKAQPNNGAGQLTVEEVEIGPYPTPKK